MLDLHALALCEQRLSGRPAPVAAMLAAAVAAPAPRAPSAPSEEAMRRCPHLAATADQGLESAE